MTEAGLKEKIKQLLLKQATLLQQNDRDGAIKIGKKIRLAQEKLKQVRR